MKLFLFTSLLALYASTVSGGVANLGGGGGLLKEPHRHATRYLRKETRNPDDVVANGLTLGELQSKWWNWNICEGAFVSTDGTCASQDQVPDGFLFLAGAVGDCSRSVDPLIRTCTIEPGTYWVFQPIVNQVCSDYDDDKDPVSRDDCIAFGDIVAPVSSYSSLFGKVDGSHVHIFYVYDDTPRYFERCLNKQKACCDDTDKPVCEHCDGVDGYPAYGWWLLEEVTRASGELHTFEESANLKAFKFCPRVIYKIAAA